MTRLGTRVGSLNTGVDDAAVIGSRIRLYRAHFSKLKPKAKEQKRVVPTTAGKAWGDSNQSGKVRFIPKKPADTDAPPNTSAATLIRSSVCMILLRELLRLISSIFSQLRMLRLMSLTRVRRSSTHLA